MYKRISRHANFANKWTIKKYIFPTNKSRNLLEHLFNEKSDIKNIQV